MPPKSGRSIYPAVSSGGGVIRANRKGTIFDEKAVKQKLEAAMKETTKIGREYFDQITSTWEHSVPIEERGPDYVGGDLISEILTEDRPFYWLDKGTRERHALMSEDFRAKTAVRRYASGAGAGNPDPVAVGWNIQLDGIQAREWTAMMADDLTKELKSQLDKQFGDLASFI